MQKVIKVIDKERAVVRVTMADERWYIKPELSKEQMPEVITVPSVTWISHFYYTSPWLIKWIADKGLDEAEAIKRAAGDKGSKVHKAIDLWLDDVEIKIDTNIVNPSTGLEEELTPEENECFKSFIVFYQKYRPKVLAKEYVVWGDGYAGTVDLKCEIDGVTGILDFKSSQQVYTEHKLQVSAYKHADPDCDKIQKLWILQLGYRRNSDQYKLTEIEDKFKLFLNAKETWVEERGNEKPKIIEYPLVYPTKKQLDAVNLPVAEAQKAKAPVKKQNAKL